jgi:predicted DNA-binding transcriptional regulator YafY
MLHRKFSSSVMFSPAAMRAALASAEPPDADGWVRVTVRVESVKHAPVQLLRLGAEAEVLSPPEIRRAVAEAAAALARLYRVP